MAGLETPSEYSEMAQAVSLGLAVLRKCKKNSWEELVAAMAADDVTVIKAFQAVDLTGAQLDLMGRRQHEICLIRISPAVVPAICPACGLFILTSDAAPAKCQVTAGCEGKPAKVAAAKATKAPPAPAPEPEPAVVEPAPTLEVPVAEEHDFMDAAADEPFDEPEHQPAAGASLEDLAEDFNAPVLVPARGRVVIEDDNDFD